MFQAIRKIPRSLMGMTIGMIIANLAGEMFYPMLPLYLESLGASVQDVGLFFTLQVILSICFRILGGWISDYMGRLPTIALGGIFGMGAITGYTIAPTWEWAALGALMSAIGSSMVGPSFQAYIAEQAPEGEINSTYGLISGLFLVCAIIGPLLGGFMMDRWGYKTTMWTATAIFYVAAGMRLWMARHSRFEIKRLQSTQLVRDLRMLVGLLLAGGILTWLFLVDGLTDAGNQVAFPFLPKFITEVGGMTKAAYGGMISLMSLVSALAMWPCGRFADRAGERLSIALGLGVAGGVMVLISMIQAPIALVLAFATFGFSQALIGPAFSGLLSKAVPKGSLGITWGLFMTALGVMAIPAPIIGGFLYDHVAPEAAFVVAAVCTLTGIPLVLLKLRLAPPAELHVEEEIAPLV
jgi:MFS family permease